MFQTINFIKRTITSLILGPVMLFIIWQGGQLFSVVMLAVCAIMITEMVNISFSKEVGFSLIKRITLSASGVFYITLASVCIVSIRDFDAIGREHTFWLFLTVWSVDIGAYVCGNIFGGPKLLPSVSPNKTWSGLIGGCLFATLIGFFMTLIMPSITAKYILLSTITAFVAQCGDLLESFIKRITKTKDSGRIIPGHGGMLDRMDGVLLAAIFVSIVFFI